MSTEQRKKAETVCFEQALAIIKKFDDPLKPTEIGDFKELIFVCLYKAIVHRKDTILTKPHLSTAYGLWDILASIEYFNEFYLWPTFGKPDET